MHMPVAVCDRLTSLRNTLSGRRVTELRELARSYYVSGYTRMKKADLIDAVFDALLDMERMTEILYVTDPKTWRLFQHAAVRELIRVTRTTPPQHKLLVELGYLALQQSEEDAWLFMPDEIRTVYDDLAMGGLVEKKEHFDLIHTYAQAAAHLYGAISLVDFAALFNLQNERKTSPEEMLPSLLRHISVDADYCIWREYLICRSYLEEAEQRVPTLLSQIGDRPRHVPERKELLRYFDADYFEQTEHAEMLRQYLTDQLGLKKADIKRAVTLIHFGCQLGASPASAAGILTDYEPSISEKQLAEVTGIIRQMFDTTRLPALNGHTLEEARKLESAVRPAQPHRKIGRNDPCPCGSGRKYKRCCGR